jgi:tryptophan 2,3-dioxygenase
LVSFENLPEKEKNNLDLVNSMRHFDHTVNVKWVMEHYNTASKYLDGAKKLKKQLEEVIGKNICILSIREEHFFQNYGPKMN